MDDWRVRWVEGRTGWDLGGPHPALEKLLTEARDWRLLPDRARILEPGAGRAHNGAALARQGYQVISFDLVPEAIEEARRLYDGVAGLELAVADAFALPPAWVGAFDAVFDRAMLCALPPARRRDYLRSMFEALVPGGAFLSLPFTEVEYPPGGSGPPFALPMPELERLMSPGFALVHAEERPLPDDIKIRREMICVWRRRSRWLVES
jgi:SAM-dependent methyltransferase